MRLELKWESLQKSPDLLLEHVDLIQQLLLCFQFVLVRLFLPLEKVSVQNSSLSGIELRVTSSELAVVLVVTDVDLLENLVARVRSIHAAVSPAVIHSVETALELVVVETFFSFRSAQFLNLFLSLEIFLSLLSVIEGGYSLLA